MIFWMISRNCHLCWCPRKYSPYRWAVLLESKLRWDKAKAIKESIQQTSKEDKRRDRKILLVLQFKIGGHWQTKILGIIVRIKKDCQIIGLKKKRSIVLLWQLWRKIKLHPEHNIRYSSPAVLIFSNTEEWLTCWMGVQQPCQLMGSGKTLKSNSPTGWVFSPPHQLMECDQTLESNSQAGWVFSHHH